MGLEIKGSSYSSNPRLASIIVFWFVVAIAIISLVLYAVGQSIFTQPAFHYSVSQGQSTVVTYASNNLFTGEGTRQGEGFVTELTDTISANFDYRFKGSSEQDLTHTYSVVATVTALHREGMGDTEIKVWQKAYPLVPTTKKQSSNGQVSVNESVTVPFREYNEQVARLSADLGVTLTGSLDVVFSMQTQGQVDGETVDTIDTSSFSTKLVRPVFSLSSKYEKHREDSFVSVNPQYMAMRPYLLIAALISAAIASAMAVRFYTGRQRSAFKKSSYQRELANIYRLHDGVIIRSNERVEIDHSKVISLQTFNDLLSMGEQLQLPIIASELDESSTQFIVTHDDTLFVYTLGKPTDESVLRSAARARGRIPPRR